MVEAVGAAIPNEWHSFVEKVLSVWSGYQLAIDFHSAGLETLEKHKWFVDVLAEHIYVTRGLKVDDLEEWISSILNQEFDLILEDDSIYPTSSLLLEGFSYMKNNNQERLSQLVASLPSQEQIQEAKRQCRQESDEEVDGDEDMEMSEGENDNDEDQNGGPSQRERQPRTVTDDDGWTTILRR